MSVYILRYKPDSSLGQRFPLTKYPWRGPGFPTRERAEELRALCINAEHIEVIEMEADA